jgi:hypothetical protein
MNLIKLIYATVIVLVTLAPLTAFSQQADVDPKKTEVWKPVPEIVLTEGEISVPPPSDAIVLFDGSGLHKWASSKHDYRYSDPETLARMVMKDEDAEWKVENGILTVVPGTGNIRTRQRFEDMQLHIEWRIPENGGQGQNWGNSGVFIQGRYEVQILNSWGNENPTYSNGMAGSIYKQHIPLVNASRAPGEWQNYQITYFAPRFTNEGKVKKPARVTVLHNGILVQDNVEIKGNTVHRGPPYYDHHGAAPIVLQDHGDKVSFRNIWVREL